MKEVSELPVNRVLCGNCLEVLRGFPEESIDMVMTSPPYWGLRNYGELTEVYWGDWRGQLGLEPTWQMYVSHMVSICRQIKRVLKKTGSMYVVLGDTYASKSTGSLGESGWGRPNSRDQSIEARKHRNLKGYKSKCLMGMPWRVAFALIEDGWILRNDVIWRKPNAMPSSVKDRLSATYEHIFHFVQARKYYYDLDVIRIPWTDQRKADIQRALNKHPGYKGKYGKGYNYGFRKFLPGQGIKGQPVGDPRKGKNLGDVFQTQKKPYVGNNPHRMRLEKQKFLALDPARPMDLSHPKGKNPGDFWSINTKPFRGAHFAVYPEAICVRPIKSSCPRFVCKKCGKPRTRITKRIPPNTERFKKKKWLKETTERGEGLLSATKGAKMDRSDGHSAIARSRPLSEVFAKTIGQRIETVGWSDCGCNADFEPGVVLDPMCGSGTTLVVARKLGRKWVGIDVNLAYVEMARKRVSAVSERLDAFMGSNPTR